MPQPQGLAARTNPQELAVKKFGLDDTLMSFVVCAVVAVLGCVGIVAWHDAEVDLSGTVTAIATAAVAPWVASR
jgi:hypothetical protein